MKHWIISGVLAAAMLLAGCAGQGTGPMQGGSAGALPTAGPEACLLQACQEAGSGMQEQAYHKITAEEAKQMMDEGGVTVVDVRTEAEYKEGHIPGAVLVPNETIGSEPPEALPELDAVLLVHCRTGVRSKQAADKLGGMGYTPGHDWV